MIYYIPGCDVNRNHPEAGHRALAYMEEKGVPEGRCCRKKIDYLKDGDTLVTDCTQCNLIFAERVPSVHIISLYEFVLQDPRFFWKDHHGEAMTLQDCWRTRNDPVIQDAVRECLWHMNISVTELENSHEKADFCGVWLNNPAPEDCVRAAPKTFRMLEEYRTILSPEEQKAKMEAYVREHIHTERTAVYCNGCEKGLRLGGAEPVHMIELLFGD